MSAGQTGHLSGGAGANYLPKFLPISLFRLGSEQKRPGANRPPEFVPESPLQKGVFGSHIFSPRNYRENAHSKSANFEGRHSGGHLLGRPLLFTSDRRVSRFIGVSGLLPPIRKILVYTGMLPCLVP